jgi:hypothetical protein
MNPISLTSNGPVSPAACRYARQANSPRTSALAWPTAARSRKCRARPWQMAASTVASRARAWSTADLTAIRPARTRSTLELTAIHLPRTRSTAVCRAVRCRMAIPWRDSSPGCRTAGGSPLARTAFTGRAHRVRRAEQRAGIPRPRHHHILSPRTRTRSAATGGGHLRRPLLRPVRPGRAAQSRVRAVKAVWAVRAAPVRAGLRKVRRDFRLRLDPQGFPAPPGSRRRASTRACRVPASTPSTAVSA